MKELAEIDKDAAIRILITKFQSLAPTFPYLDMIQGKHYNRGRCSIMKKIFNSEDRIDAINTIQHLISAGKFTDYNGSIHRALDVAINAMENVGCGCSLCLSHNNMQCPKMLID